MRRPGTLLRLAATLALLAVLWWAVDAGDALGALRGADPRWLAAGAAALTAQTLLSAARWRLTAARLGQRIEPGRAVAEYYLAQILNQILPGGVLGDAGRALRGRRQAGLLRAGQAVVIERAFGQVALIAVTALGLAATAALGAGPDWPGWAWAPPVLALALPLGGLAALSLPARTRAALAATLRAARWAVSGGALLPQAALSLGTVACNLAAFWCCARAVGAGLPAMAAVTIVPLVLLSMVVPLSVAGWGLREGAAAALWPLAGGSAAGGLSASIAFGLVFAAASLPGLAVLLRRRRAAPETPAAANVTGPGAAQPCPVRAAE